MDMGRWVAGWLVGWYMYGWRAFGEVQSLVPAEAAVRTWDVKEFGRQP